MKFFIEASYSTEGAKGVLTKGGGSDRKKMTKTMIGNLGGKMESYYYVSNCDAYVICELPNAAAAAAIALSIKASGMGSIKVTPLLEAEEIDKATKMSVKYRHPGK